VAGDEVLRDRVYSQVSAGGMSLIKTFREKDVIHLYANKGWTMSGGGTSCNLDAIKKTYIRLTKAAISGYTRSRGLKGTLEMDTTLAGTQAFQDNLQKIRSTEFGKFAEADNAILPLYKGMKYNALGEKTYSGETTRDVRNLVDDAVDYVARSYGIPPQLVNGSNTDVEPALEYALTSFFDPLFRQISNEITRKRYGERAVLRGDYLRIDTRQIKHPDIIGEASHLSSLIGSGVVSINDVLRMLGDAEINEDWANGHFITLNNAPAGAVVTPSKGGEQKRTDTTN
jgi:HK97 family phage portal protein